MARLGYKRWVAQGGDWGVGVATAFGHISPPAPPEGGPVGGSIQRNICFKTVGPMNKIGESAQQTSRRSRGGKNPSPSKDAWDKLAALTVPFVSLVLGLLGAYATYTYNQTDLRQKDAQAKAALALQAAQAQADREHRALQATDARLLGQAQTLEHLFQFLSSSDPQKREFGYAMFAAMGKGELAAKLIALKHDKAGTTVLKGLATSADPTIKSVAAQSLALLDDKRINFSTPIDLQEGAKLRVEIYGGANAQVQFSFFDAQNRELFSNASTPLLSTDPRSEQALSVPGDAAYLKWRTTVFRVGPGRDFSARVTIVDKSGKIQAVSQFSGTFSEGQSAWKVVLDGVCLRVDCRIASK